MTELNRKLRNIKLFLFDLDGILITDFEKSSDANLDDVLKKFSDLCEILKNKGILAGVVTAHENGALIEKIKYSGCCIVLNSSINKVDLVTGFIEDKNIDFHEIAYTGDEILDIPLLQKTGVKFTTGDARREVKRVVDKIIRANNGSEFIERFVHLLKEARVV